MSAFAKELGTFITRARHLTNVTNALLDNQVHLCTFVDNVTSEPLKFSAGAGTRLLFT